MAKRNSKFKIVFLGGMGEIGKNMTVFEYNNELIVVDAGVMFPEDDMPGVDLVIPDTTYLMDNAHRIKAVILTHGHEDHIGGVPFLLKQVNIPVYGTKLTLGLLKLKLIEHNLERSTQLHEVKAGQRIKIGKFDMEFIHVNHSIPDVVALAIHTELGTVIHCSDFKFDQTPIDGRVTDLYKLAQLGNEGVLCLLSDSTNAERPGYTESERTVGETFARIFARAEGRIFVATFASNVHRLQQIVDASEAQGRKICVIGRSMVNVVGIAQELGYLKIPEGMLIDVEQVDKLPADKVVIITTGSQGEPMSALTRIAMAEHRKLAIAPGDTVIISANPIPGNEKSVGKIINHLFKEGATVVYEPHFGIHTSGHAQQEELKLLLNLTKPKYFVPIHGEHRMLMKHAELAETVGVPKENICIAELGSVLEFSDSGLRMADRVASGQVFVDGLGVGDVGNIVLRDRRQLASDGILIVVVTISGRNGEILAGPDIVTRGFVYVRESEELIEEARERVRAVLAEYEGKGVTEWGLLKQGVREALSRYLYEKTKRRPMILPIIMEV
ncbi:MAG: ribonuclease J [Candidatus Wallacebacter cryptica]|nr:ribonuclease J [Bacillota bacterium]